MTQELRGLSILFVDDDVSTVGALERYFESSGASVLTAAGGAQALEILSRVDVDLVVSDLAMPGMNGVTFIKEVRRLPDERARSTPAIAYTASPQLERAAREAGFDAVVPKPVDPAVLGQEMGRVAMRRRADPHS